MNKAILALLLATGVVTPALADPPSWSSNREHHDRDRHDRGNRGEWRGDRHDRWSGNRHWDGRGDHRNWDRHDSRDRDWRRHYGNDGRWGRDDWRSWRRYDYHRPDPRYGGYYADRYYRDGRYYGVRRLGRDDRIYRGYNGRYYCRRSDGTTGLLLGALGGGLLGDAVAPGDSRTVGALIGGGLGALLGREIDRDGVRCR